MATDSYLLHRGDDLVALGVVFDGFSPSATSLVAGDAAVLTVVLPPQAVAEQRVAIGAAVADGQVLAGRVGGPSRIALQVAAGTAVPLTVEGVLAAMGGAPLRDDTALELPWHLVHVPVAATPGEAVTMQHSATVAAAGSVSALWQSRLAAASGLRMRPVATTPDDPAVTASGPLSELDRNAVLGASRPDAAHPDGVLPTLARLTVSALGGSLTAHAVWPQLSWDHDTALGRDQRVRVLRHGSLFPFGHRATLLELAERGVADDGVAALRLTTVLSVDEPVRRLPDDGSARARAFPFDTAELLLTAVTDVVVDDSVWRTYVRPTEVTQPLADALAALQHQLADAQAAVDAELANAPTTPQQLADQGDATADLYLSTQARADELNAAIADYETQFAGWASQHDELQRQADEVQREIDSQVQGPDGPDPALSQQLAEIASELTALGPPPTLGVGIREAAAQATASAAALLVQVQAVLDGWPRSLEALTARGDPSALAVRDLPGQIAAAQAVLEGAQTPENAWLPVLHPDAGGATVPVAFPVRLHGTAGDLAVEVPMAFVTDLVVPPDPALGYAGYEPLADPALPAVLADTVLPPAGVATAATPVDVVRSPAPKPADVVEVHALRFAASLVDRVFVPALSGLRVDLPALRTLLPGTDTVVDAVLSADLLDAGPAAARCSTGCARPCRARTACVTSSSTSPEPARARW